MTFQHEHSKKAGRARVRQVIYARNEITFELCCNEWNMKAIPYSNLN